MEQQPSSQPQKTVHIRKFAIIALIIVAVAVIVASLFMVFNPNGIETADDVQDVSIALNDEQVAPQTVHIAKGATIRWDNLGATARHLIISSSNPQQTLEGFGDEDGILQDESYSFTFDTAGSFTYEDTTQPEKINGTIVVE